MFGTIRVRKGILASLFLCVSMSPGVVIALAAAPSPASSQGLEQPAMRADTAKPDSCTAYLEPIRTASDAMTPRPAQNNPHAGKAAALGLIFGIQYASGPLEQTSARDRVVATQNSKAQAIAQYRKCRSEQILNLAQGSV